VTAVLAMAALRRRLPLLLATATATAAILAVGAFPASAQFRPKPWATVNACDPPTAPGSVGVRVSIPNRRNAAQWVRIRLQFFDGTRGAWRVVRSGGDAGFTKLSDGGGRVFGGTTFTFTPPPAGRQIKLRGLVDVEWRRGRKVLDHARVTTHGNHLSATDPLLAASAPTCEIKR
jgi:hypothetical protein